MDKCVPTRASRFQPTLPARGATRQDRGRGHYQRISTHAPRTGSDPSGSVISSVGMISTHAPRTGSDICLAYPSAFSGISTHAPRTGSDIRNSAECGFSILFQPTLPARGATWMVLWMLFTLQNFNPRSPHGERLRRFVQRQIAAIFQPTLPARGATIKAYLNYATSGISTHAPRTGSDLPAH